MCDIITTDTDIARRNIINYRRENIALFTKTAHCQCEWIWKVLKRFNRLLEQEDTKFLGPSFVKNQWGPNIVSGEYVQSRSFA